MNASLSFEAKLAGLLSKSLESENGTSSRYSLPSTSRIVAYPVGVGAQALTLVSEGGPRPSFKQVNTFLVPSTKSGQWFVGSIVGLRPDCNGLLADWNATSQRRYRKYFCCTLGGHCPIRNVYPINVAVNAVARRECE